MSGEDGPDLPPLPAWKLRPAWQPAPPGPGELVYPGVGIRTRPAPVGLAPRFTLAEATQQVQGLWRPVEPEIELRLVTTGDFPRPPSRRPAERPGWVFTYLDTPVTLHGPRGRRRHPQEPLTGVSTVIIDAGTGELILNCQSRPGPIRGPVTPRPAAPPR